MNINCPKCNELFAVVAEAIIPKTQVMHMRLTSESELFPAEVVGKAIIHMEELQRSVADNLGVKVSVFLKSLVVTAHEVTIGFQIIQNKTGP